MSEPSLRVEKSATAFRTISEVSDELDIPQHVLRFWETKFLQIRPLKRGGGRRYYRPEDVDLLRRISSLLYREGYTIRGVQKLLREGQVPRAGSGQPEATPLALALELGDAPEPAIAKIVNLTSNPTAPRPQEVAVEPDMLTLTVTELLSELIELRTLLRHRER